MSNVRSTIPIYDGRRCIGHIHKRRREHVARTWPDEVLVGAFPSRKQAADALTVACRTRQGDKARAQ
jgi:hypothetical protein